MAEFENVFMVDHEQFCNYLVAVKQLQPNSVRLVTSRLKLIDEFLKIRHLEFKQENVELFIATKKQRLKNNSVNSYILSINTLLEYFEHRNSPLPFKKIIPFRKNKTVIKVLSNEEIDRILMVDRQYGKFHGKDCSRLNKIYKTFIMFLSMSGGRFTESSRVRVRDCDFERLEVFFEETKNGDWRKVYITPPIAELMLSIIKEEDLGYDDFVFTNMTGHPIRQQELGEELRYRAKIAGITKRVHCHLFRHSYATHLREQGVDIDILATILGHRDIQTTYDTYVHLADKTIRDATRKHDRYKKYLSIKEKLDNASKVLLSLNLDKDPDFITELQISNNALIFRVSTNKPIAD